MELFRLFGRIAIENSEANEALDETSKKGEGAQTKLSGAFSKMGSVAKVAGAAIVTAFAAAATAVVGLGTAAIKSYADYEQLVGGVETLFDNSEELEIYTNVLKRMGYTAEEIAKEIASIPDPANTVMKNAAIAFKTAGMSANEYMETVTSFSASLIQSLGGDTTQAAEYADRAIIDMSDNANKMGSSMESIQNAYQGFAKQNYTMLDNLKLGYGGTKEEMARLLEDATALSGVEYDLSSFADITEAIHVIQTELGITGTTAKEASTTISGSIASMKAAWQNLLVGMADGEQDMELLVTNLGDSILTVGKNLLPRIQQTLSGIGEFIKIAVPKILKEIPPLLMAFLPQLLSTAITFLKTIATTIVSELPQLAATIFQALGTLFAGQGDTIRNAFSGIFSESLLESIDTLTSKWGVMVEGMGSSVFSTISENFTKIQTAAENLLPSIQHVAENGITILIAGFDTFMATIETVFVPLFNLVSTVLTDLGTTIAEAVAPGVVKISDAFTAMRTTVSEAIQTYILPVCQSFIEMVQNLYTENQDKITKIGELFGIIFDKIGALFEWFNTNVVQGVFVPAMQAIADFANENMGTIEEIFQSAFDILGGIVDFFIALFTGDWQEMWAAVQNISDSTVESVKQTFTLMKEALSTIMKNISAYFSLIWNNIHNYISSKINQISNIVQTIFNGILSFIRTTFSNIYNAIAEKVNSIKDKISTTFENIKSAITEKVNSVKNTISTVFENIRSTISNKVNSAKTTISTVFENIKTTVTDKVNSVKNTVSDVFSNIYNSISEKINAAKDAVSTAIESIKSFFNFEWKLPDLKLPHISISGEWDLINGTFPSFGIEWYAKGAVLNQPTVFGMNGTNAMVGGEAGAEAVAPIDVLQKYVADAVRSQDHSGEIVKVLNLILEALYNLDETLVEKIVTALVNGVSIDWNDRNVARLVRSYVG